MTEQNFKNHTRLVPLYHYVAFALLAFALVASLYFLYKALMSGSGRFQAATIFSIVACLGIVTWYARAFALKAQDRAIRAEENFRHYILTGKPLPKELRMGQIVGLRFAGDAEFPALAEKAVKEQLSSKAIKEAIQNWRADYNRA